VITVTRNNGNVNAKEANMKKETITSRMDAKSSEIMKKIPFAKRMKANIVAAPENIPNIAESQKNNAVRISITPRTLTIIILQSGVQYLRKQAV
jgi:hypothetical protein